VPRPEIVQGRFGVPLLTGKLVMIDIDSADDDLAAIGIVIRLPQNMKIRGQTEKYEG
jgi:hypothetical protein